jgi:PAS domain S-box-containing protein
VSVDAKLVDETATELFEEAPCGYLTTQLDGTILKMNRTLERWTGFNRDELVGAGRFQDLLSVGGRIYYETHYAPLLQMQGAVSEIALEVVRADGSRLPALVNSVVHRDEAGHPAAIRTTVFDATDRRRYEEELVNARERDRNTALWLQRSLLDGALPSSPSFELEVFYAAAGLGNEVGGDWYDAFWLDGGEIIALVVGDVVGRGLTAATTMGQLRSAVRALAAVKLPPSSLLEALDTYADRHEIGAMTTVAYAELNTADGDLRFACAGHPPPLIHEPGAPPQLTWDGRSAPISALPAGARRDEGELKLGPGTTVLLYTDGLIEHRRRPADQGMQDLIRLVAEHDAGPLRALIDTVTEGLFDPGAGDDRSLLGVRLRPQESG